MARFGSSWSRQELGGVGPLSAALRITSRGAAYVGKRPFLPQEVLVAGAARTPIGSLCGSLSSLSAARLGSAAISAALQRAGVEADEVDAVVMGQALPSGCGQNVARQAALAANIPPRVDCTGINKACSSGLKAISIAAQMIALGHADVVVAGGMESMSQAPYLLRNARAKGFRYGHVVTEDSALLDGLTDAHENRHLGSCAEETALEMGIDREDQDKYTISSYRRSADAWQRGAFDLEVAPVRVQNSKGSKSSVISIDEDYSRLRIDQVASLPAVFEEQGTITAASASSLNDGAAAVVLVSAERARELSVRNPARIVSFADHAVEPSNFATAPAGAIRKALNSAGMQTVDYFEINEAFALVPLANAALLDVDLSRVNVNGGAVSLGHPLGASGARIFCTLLSVLEQRTATTGCAAIANGGGGATAIVVER